jgi:hypothetical protein
MYLEVNDVAPVRNPLVQQLPIVCFHQLVAALKRRVHPTRDIRETLWCESPVLSEPPVDRDGVAVLEVFNDHVERLVHRVGLRFDYHCAHFMNWREHLRVIAILVNGYFALWLASTRAWFFAIGSLSIPMIVPPVLAVLAMIAMGSQERPARGDAISQDASPPPGSGRT